MLIILPGTVKFMSVLIAVCGETYAILAADSRVSINNMDNKTECVNDNCHKIFQINDSLIFGGAGQFFHSEPLTAAFIGKDYNFLKLEEADKLIQGYMETVFDKLSPIGKRSYVLCGKNEYGEMCLYQYNYNLATQEKQVQRYNAPESDGDYYCIGLPPKLSNKVDEYETKIKSVLDSSRNIQDIFNGFSEIINSIATIDNMVGGKPEFVYIGT